MTLPAQGRINSPPNRIRKPLMRNFYRSLRYLKPYKTRLVFSCICVLLIAVLWGGGLGMAAPILKVIFDPEGLHGWA